jgi:DNA-binding transcriptional regulator YiaG
MPNIGALLKQEIARLARRETRAQTQSTRKASAQYRRDIAALKRDVEALKRQVALLERQARKAQPSALPASASVRFVAKGLRSQRARLGLSAQDYGRLAGVSAQSIYNWEQGNTSPRPEQVKALAALRGLGKRDAEGRLKGMESKGAGKSRKRAGR